MKPCRASSCATVLVSVQLSCCWADIKGLGIFQEIIISKTPNVPQQAV